MSKGDALGPAPGVGVVAKGPQGLLNVGGSFRADGGWRCCVPALLVSSALRFSLAICCSLATFPWPPPPSLPWPPSSNPPPPPILMQRRGWCRP
jgi:hypothetical protein